jgi:hypothetical protein
VPGEEKVFFAKSISKPDLLQSSKSHSKKDLSKNKIFPIPGVEPGPAGWKPAILAVRPYGMIN